MPNDTTITISRRFIHNEYVMDSLPRLALKNIDVSLESCKLQPVEALPELTFVFDTLESIMPIEAEFTFSRQVEVVAYPMDSLTDYSVPFMSFITVLYLVFQWAKWSNMIKELKGCFS